MQTQLHLDLAFPDEIIQATKSRYFHNRFLPVQIARRNPQPLYPLHNHDFDEIAYTLKGYGVNFMDGQFLVLLPGTVLHLAAQDTHAYPLVDQLSLINIYFERTRLTANFPKILSLLETFQTKVSNVPRFVTDYSTYAQLQTLAHQLGSDTFNADDFSEYSAIAHLMQFLVLTLRHANEPKLVTLTGSRIEDRVFRLFADPDFPELFDNRSLLDKATSYGLSWRSFERFLSDFTSLSPHRLCTLNRLVFFLNILLRKPDLCLESAGAEAGYQDYRSLSRNCLNLFGKSPKEVREQISRFVADPPRHSSTLSAPTMTHSRSTAENSEPEDPEVRDIRSTPARKAN